MDLTQRKPFGRTGLNLGRLGLASGYGVPAEAIERAYHEHGVNYLYVSPLLNLTSMIRAVRALAPRHRDDLCIVLARPFLRGLGGMWLEGFVDRWLRRLGLSWIDLLLQDIRKPLRPRVLERIRAMREKGKVRFAGISSHERPLLGRLGAGEPVAPSDWFHVRYNAVHVGAEKDVFPHLNTQGHPGVVVFTATCWGQLLRRKGMPPGERPLTAAECYRFVLSHPDVNVCLTGPSTAAQLEENLAALERGPLEAEEMERVRRIGKHLYG
jgi:aryl-alcohol dehydrogenase-like predicted oxidoreductase